MELIFLGSPDHGKLCSKAYRISPEEIVLYVRLRWGPVRRERLLSGGFRQFTRAIREKLGADEDRAKTLIIESGRLTGKVVEPILGQDAKLAALKEIAATKELELDDALAVGDGANDLAMLEAAGVGVAYRAKPKVAARAHARIDHSDLTALLYAQGFMRKDFVDG